MNKTNRIRRTGTHRRAVLIALGVCFALASPAQAQPTPDGLKNVLLNRPDNDLSYGPQGQTVVSLPDGSVNALADAIEMAGPGGLVLVEAGTHIEESPVLIEIPIAIVGEVPVGYGVRSFEVEGMCCVGCVRKLHDALVALPGVEKAAVDFETGKVSALALTDVADTDLAAALQFEKYRVVQ